MFTLTDICNIAIQIEQNGEAAYRRAAGLVHNPELAQTLRWLADEEKLHGELFAAISADRVLSAEEAELEAMGRALLQDIVSSQTFSLGQQQLVTAESMHDLLGQSIEFERDTIGFYQFIAGFLDDDESRSNLQGIIEQEQGHVRQLERILAQEQQTCSSKGDGV